MKPRIRLRYGIWSCSSWPHAMVAGYGYTPQGAYEEWRRQAEVVCGRFS